MFRTPKYLALALWSGSTIWALRIQWGILMQKFLQTTQWLPAAAAGHGWTTTRTDTHTHIYIYSITITDRYIHTYIYISIYYYYIYIYIYYYCVNSWFNFHRLFHPWQLMMVLYFEIVLIGHFGSSLTALGWINSTYNPVNSSWRSMIVGLFRVWMILFMKLMNLV